MFLALGASRLAVWDMKTKGGVVSEQMATPVLSYAGGKDYAAGVKFSCMATSGDGYVVVGADDGKVRLYSEKTLTQAKTSIPGMGLPITAVDVTFDGEPRGGKKEGGGAGRAAYLAFGKCKPSPEPSQAAQSNDHCLLKPPPYPWLLMCTFRQVGAGHNQELHDGAQDDVRGPQQRQGAVRLHQPHGLQLARAPPATPQNG